MDKKRPISRRDFLTTTAAGAVTLAGAGANLAFGRASATLRAGLIGCGGRGTGAAADCVRSSPGVKIVALADAFKDRLDRARGALSKLGKDKVDVPADRCFVGLDAYKKLIASGVDLVLMATPPGFRPIHLAAAVQAGKHVFMEKPVAVCPAGVKMVIEASKQAAEKKLAIVAGTQRRHAANYLETMKRIRDGAIGKIVSAQCYWNQGTLWVHDRKPGYSDVEWQLRNWLYFTWLSGDHICEQHIHNIDVINWAFDALPDAVHAVGGRQARTGKRHGNIYDHFGAEFFYPGDIRTISTCRQIVGTSNRVGERVAGTKGTSDCAGRIWSYERDERDKYKLIWEYKGRPANPYVQEHTDLIRSIRSGTPLNEGKQVAESTLCAIMARESAYTRQRMNRSWFEKQCTLNLLPPENLKLTDSRPVAPVRVPGKYQLPGFGRRR